MPNPIHIFAKSLLAIAIIWQSLWPSVAMSASAAGINVSAYTCNPKSALPDAARDNLLDVLRLAGKNVPSEPDNNPEAEHCANCLIVTPAALSAAQPFTIFTNAKTSPQTPNLQSSAFGICGPPLGSRAPPTFF